MLKNKRLLLVTVLLIVAAIAVLGLRVAYPYHRVAAFLLLALGWVPIAISYRINRRLLRVQKKIISKKARPYLPHVLVAAALAVASYVAWALFPAEHSPLTDLTPSQLRREIDEDIGSYLMLRQSADDIVKTFREARLLERKVDNLTPEERTRIRDLWRDGAMVFLEFDLLKEKYRGFHQIDYLVEPALHADAFMLVYLAYIAQYDACMQVIGMVDSSDFMETLLNEEGAGIPANSYYTMKQRITHPNKMLRMSAAAAYRELIKKDVTIGADILADFSGRKKRYYDTLGEKADIFVDNPLDQLERAAFETVLPVQKRVAVRMSYIRTARREYLITPEIIAGYMPRLEPGDILIQRRNWHMTNIGIPGFWPHVALYVGTPDELKEYFAGVTADPLEKIAEQYPQAFAAWSRDDDDGAPRRVIEAIRPGVVFQSMETSSKCDYLGVIRPNIKKGDKFSAIAGAFAHHGKPYDLNFDFTTDNALVCSELVYKGYKAAAELPLTPEVINGRLLLPPNRLAEAAVRNMGADDAFSFVLFLDAVEKDDVVVERDEQAFRKSWQRPKWDVAQQ